MTEKRYRAVVIGASAGAVEALFVILPQLPAWFSLPLLVVVHLPPGKESALPGLLSGKCKLPVFEAEDKQPLGSGIYIAPPDYHLLVEPGGYLSLSSDEQVMFSRPSIDVLFESAAAAYGDELIGIVLSGANSDGAKGLQLICQAGGAGLVQRPDTAYAATMPQAALNLCQTALPLSLSDIATFLLQAARHD